MAQIIVNEVEDGFIINFNDKKYIANSYTELGRKINDLFKNINNIKRKGNQKLKDETKK